jgi:hypothetical protein
MTIPRMQRKQGETSLIVRRVLGPDTGARQLDHILEVLYLESRVHAAAVVEERHIRTVVSDG